MRRSSFAKVPMLLLLAWGIALSGCKKQSSQTTATAPAGQSAQDNVVPPPPLYTVPDKLPAHARVTLVKTDSGAAVYQAVFDSSFQFDPDRALLALEINTVGWMHHGRITITNKNDDENAGSELHAQDYDDPPTDEKLNLPEERQLLKPDENHWIKEGGVTLTIRNAEGADSATVPKILTVDLVEQGKTQ